MTPSPADDEEIDDVIAIGVANLMSLLVKARLHVKRERERESCSSIEASRPFREKTGRTERSGREQLKL